MNEIIRNENFYLLGLLAKDSLLADEDGILLLVGLLGLIRKNINYRNLITKILRRTSLEQRQIYLVSFSKFRHFARRYIMISQDEMMINKKKYGDVWVAVARPQSCLEGKLRELRKN